MKRPLRIRCKLISLALCVAGFSTAVTAQQKLVHELPSASQVRITNDVPYANAADGALRFDLYRPVKAPAGTAGYPIVIFLNGIGASWIRHHPQYSGWGKLATTVGFAGIAMDSEPGKIAANVDSLVRYLQGHAKELNVNPGHIVIYACSSNVVAGLPLIMDAARPYIRAGIIYYGSSDISNFQQDRPLLVVRAGLDSPSLNRNLDKNVVAEMAANVPVSVINYAHGHHGFELVDDNETSRQVVEATLKFLETTARAELHQERIAAAGEAAAAAALLNSNWNDAARRYRALLEQKPDSADLHAKLGDALFGGGDYAASITQYEAALRLGNPNVGMISYSAAIAALRQGDKQRALAWLARVKDIPPMRMRVMADPEFASLRNETSFVEMFAAPAEQKH